MYQKKKEITPESDINYDPVSTRWCNEKKSVFQSKFDLNKIEEASQLLETFETSIPNQNKLDETVKKISDFPLFAGMDAGMSKRITKNSNAPRPKKQNMPWFDHDCHMKKKQFSRHKNRFKRRQNEQNEEAFKSEYKSYRKFINKKRHNFNKNLHKKLRNLG